MTILKSNDKIAIICPASPSDEGSFDLFIKSHSQFEFIVNPLCFDTRDNIDKEQTQALENAFLDPSIAAIISGRGGYGTIRKLDLIDFDTIKNNPKPFFGFSDTTALQLALYKKTGLQSYTGLIAKAPPANESDMLFSSFTKIINEEPQEIKNIKLERSEKITGELIGGNLASLVSLIGTPYLPDFTDKILVLEEIDESPYRIDRMLYQLYLSGTLKVIKALCFGELTNCINPKYPDSKSALSYIEDFVKLVDCPIIYNIPYGHQNQRIIFKLGAKCEVTQDKMVIF